MSDGYVPVMSGAAAEALEALTAAMGQAADAGLTVPCVGRADEFMGRGLDPETGRACARCPLAVFEACEAWGRLSRWPGIYAGQVMRREKRRTDDLTASAGPIGARSRR